MVKMKNNIIAQGVSFFAISVLAVSLAAFSVNTYACDACKSTKSEASTTSDEQKSDVTSSKCNGDCKCKEGQAK
mgnify:CR=1 FL=1